ncbi:hypothetical protein ACHAW5_007290 [Stephanodiscus triporus]|uniref:Uncharacterized protein n=1 Tax=Stephanodiscus triporus TaxID=2934178 RepID=A0ABD3NAH4_9STRA
MINNYSSQSIRVPTTKQVHHREIDMHRLSENDLRTLRTKDPFMYHSIPAVHKATITLQEVDNAKTLLSQESSVVTRKSRLSTECHMSLLMDEEFHDALLRVSSTDSDLVPLATNSKQSEPNNKQQPE